MPSLRTPAGRAAAMFTLALAVVVPTFSLPAAAHGAEAALSVVDQRAEPDGTYYLRVRLVYQNDGEPVPGAEPTVSASSTEGGATPVGPVTLTAIAGSPGEYEGRLPLGGAGPWSLDVSSVDPDATLTVADVVVPTTTTAPPTTAATTTVAPTTTESPTTTADAGAGTSSDTGTADDDTPVGVIVAVIVGGLAVIAGGVAVARHRRS